MGALTTGTYPARGKEGTAPNPHTEPALSEPTVLKIPRSADLPSRTDSQPSAMLVE